MPSFLLCCRKCLRFLLCRDIGSSHGQLEPGAAVAGKDDKAVFLTDYAHHPAEIRQSVISIRELYRGKKIAAIFQPHLYTRTRDFYKEFAESLSLLDEVILTDIYPARETPIPGVTSRLIYDRLAPTVKKCLCRKEDVPEIVRQSDADVFILLGAGDLESYAPQITEILKER